MQRITPPMLAWFEANKRSLEWRTDPLPYYVWVSEIMLQQTRVSAVRPYFRRFVRELPDAASLARCGEERLLKLWEGLGYYSRARNLQKAARVIVERYDGILPSDPALLRSLPGIGSYTAGAVASIAYGVPEPAVDGNVLRVLSRVTGSAACIDDPKVKRLYEERLRGFLKGDPAVPPGQFNQALMEIGALVCLPNGVPECGKCPLRAQCAALREGQTGSIPVRREKKARRVEERTVVLVRDAANTLIRKRPAKGLLAGLWEFPNFPGHLSEKEVLDEAYRIALKPLRILPLPDAKHIFTHVEWRMKGYQLLVEDMCDRDPETDGCLAVSPDSINAQYPIPAAFAKYAEYLKIRVGHKK